MRTSTCLIITALGLALAALPAAAQVDVTYSCNATPTGSVEWPAGNPAWTFDFVRPSNSSGGDGSGLELRDVYYNGHLVFKRAHTPILNVEYDAGGCGCFRDWSYSESNMEADGVQAGSCVALSTPGTVRTTCDTGVGGTPGSFKGVAFEEYQDELVLTTHMSAGWYRYRMKWHFYLDGRIWPEYSFASSNTTCTSATHRHHVYWRFDFDLDGAANDVVTEFNPVQGTSTLITIEDDRTWGNGTDGIYWRVADTVTDAAYRIVPSAADLLLPVDPFSIADAIILRYNAGEIHDGSAGCAINFNSEINGQDVNGQDIVFWYRGGASHTGGNPYECDIVGPTLYPEGAIPVELTSFGAVLLADGTARLNWATSSETNNAGFDVEHRLDEDDWVSVGFVEGHGTTTETNNYSFVTNVLERGGIHSFRLKQVDYDGQFEYSNEVEVAVDVPGSYALESAYPNPFNPSTAVRFSVAQSQHVTITLYDALGRQVADLYDGYAEANHFETIRVDGSFLPSGTYSVRLEGETVLGTTRIVLIK
ncbi:MAG: T9SS type A sorting domain-containing protein [Bacteroidetes bacterium]|nr:T9SS type A sorting domain-containing protein [Bacteroidota bacterium]